VASFSLPDGLQVLAVAAGGAIGSVARFVAGYYAPVWFGAEFPWATMFVNVTGSLWLGFFGTLATAKPGTIDPVMRLFLTTGFAGGFTTFSTYAFESMALYQRGDTSLAIANILGNLVLGILGAVIGAVVARLL
jgi:CrcB protein